MTTCPLPDLFLLSSNNITSKSINIYMIKKCKYCLENIETTSGRSFSNHVRWCDKNPKISHYRKNKNLSSALQKRSALKVKQFNVVCESCDVEFTLNETEKRHARRKKFFCSRSCANSRKNSKAWNTAVASESHSMTQKQRWCDPEYRARMAEHRAKQPKIFTSKNERDIVKYIKEKYPEDEWKSGSNLKLNNDISLARDLWSDKLKVCFEYDGVWHFEDIHGQLVNKQLKDRLLEEWCITNNYRLIRIDEEVFTSISQIEELIYTNTESIIKVGNRYK